MQCSVVQCSVLTRLTEADHVIVGDVNIRVADAAELNVEGDVLVAAEVPLDLDLLKGGLGGGLGPGESRVHSAGLDVTLLH